MEAKLFDLFSWRAGSFAFKEGQPVPGEPVALERTTSAIILEGIRRHYDDARLDAVLAAYEGQFVVPSSDPLQRLQGITSEPNEQAFVDRIDGTRRIEAVLADATIARDKARLLLVAMAEAGMIEPGAARRSAADDRRRAALDATPLSPPKSRSELDALLEANRAMTLFEVLGVSDTARELDIEAAYERLAREFHPDRYRARSAASRELAQKIFDRLAEARVTLTDPAKRARYLAGLEKVRASAKGRADADTAAEQVYYTGVEHLRARRYGQAVEAFRRASVLAPGRAGYHGALGWALYRQAPAEAAAVEAGLSELRRAVALDPKDAWIRVSLGRFYAETGRPDLAISELESALALNPSLTDVEEEMRRLRGDGPS
jgi:tetratricopeptide (TPR) repeat protein